MGKSSSKLKKRRTQSVAWSFRFSSSKNKNKGMVPVLIGPYPHLEITEWLKRLELDEYAATFEKFSGVEELIHFSEGDIHKLGVKNSAHRARMVSSLVALRDKKDRQNNNHNNGSTIRKPQRHSMAPDVGRKKDEMPPIYEVLAIKDGKQSKSVGDLLDMDPTTPEATQEALALKKALEWELSLDSRDLRSHAWYHGPIPRQRAEEIVTKEGDFLIRDCVSQPGNYVLTCRSKGPTLHFVINKIVLQPDTVYERVQYQFEDDAYDTIPDLITFYVGSGKPISAASGARIQFPCNRLYPLSFYASKYTNSRGQSPISPGPGIRYNPYTQPNNSSTYRSPMSSPPRTKREVPPRLPSKKQRSQSLTPNQQNLVNNSNGARHTPNQEKYCSADGVIQEKTRPDTQSLPRAASAQGIRTFRLHSRTSSLTRDCSDSSLSPCLEQRGFSEVPSPPPKPVRGSSLTRNGDEKENRQVRDPSYRASGSDSGNGSGDSAQSSTTGEEVVQPRSGVIIRNPRYLPHSASSVTLRGDFDPVAVEQSLLTMHPIATIEQSTVYDLDSFQTLLLPFVENKPLDAGSLNTIKLMLIENGSRIIAMHLTRADVKLILGDDDQQQEQERTSPLDCCGLELITTEQGKQFRKDLIERTQCIKLLVATTILTCTSDTERAETINRWIQIAIDTKTALGNLFGFCAIMLGLCMQQVQNLTSTWHTLRQKYTDSAFTFEAKLRPTLKSMNDCTNPQAPNTTIPHLLPYIILKDRTVDDLLGASISSSLVNCVINSWESIAEDFGLSITHAHLESSRSFLQNLNLYKKNAQIVLSDTSRLDSLLEEAFRTEYHIKFLWGSKGAFAAAEDRHTKFEQVLTAMAEKFCIMDDPDT